VKTIAELRAENAFFRERLAKLTAKKQAVQDRKVVQITKSTLVQLRIRQAAKELKQALERSRMVCL
jgi:hypothetical protein